MPVSGRLDNIFSSLIPVKNKKTGDLGGGNSKPIFRLEVIEGEPFITVTDSDRDPRQLPVSVARVYKEIRRLSEGEDLFGFGGAVKNNIQESLWNSPYLLNLIDGQVEV